MDYEEGRLANVETLESEIPVNIHAEDDSDFTLQEGENCNVEIYAVGNNFKLYSSETEYKASGKKMAVMSMIPAGTFPVDPEDKNFRESAHIIYTGKVLNVSKEQDEKGKDGYPNYFLKIQSYEIEFGLYVYYDGEIKKGDIISGMAWLFGTIAKKGHE